MWTKMTQAVATDSPEELVKAKYPKAYIKRTSSEIGYDYEVRVKIDWFFSEPISDVCHFEDDAWTSAYKRIEKIIPKHKLLMSSDKRITFNMYEYEGHKIWHHAQCICVELFLNGKEKNHYYDRIEDVQEAVRSLVAQLEDNKFIFSSDMRTSFIPGEYKSHIIETFSGADSDMPFRLSIQREGRNDICLWYYSLEEAQECIGSLLGYTKVENPIVAKVQAIYDKHKVFLNNMKENRGLQQDSLSDGESDIFDQMIVSLAGVLGDMYRDILHVEK